MAKRPPFIGPGMGANMSAEGTDVPEQDPNYTQGGAPGGDWFGSDLPVKSITGPTPMTTDGFTPESGPARMPEDPTAGK